VDYPGNETVLAARIARLLGIVGGSIIYKSLIEGGECLHVHIDLKNFGNTPGYKMTTWIKQPKILGNDAVPFDSPTPLAERTGESIMAPSGTFFIDWILPINIEDISALNDGSKKIYIWGGVDFIDAFGKNRYFIFRMTNSDGAIIKLGDGFALRPHKAGYDAN